MSTRPSGVSTESNATEPTMRSGWASCWVDIECSPALHAAGRAHAEQLQRVLEDGARRAGQLEPRGRERGVVPHDPARMIELMERGGEFLRVGGEPVRLARFRRPRGHVREMQKVQHESALLV